MTEVGTRHGRRWAEALLAMASLIWLALSQEVAARAATGLGSRILGGVGVFALQGLMTLFLVVVGLKFLGRTGRGEIWLQSGGLVRRPTAPREWALGTAVAWGLVVLSVVPLVICGSLQVTFWLAWRALSASVLSVIGVAAMSLSTEMVYRGFALTRLERSVGRTLSVLFLIFVFGSVYGRHGPRSFLVACALATLFSTGWLRTHAVWLPWGLHLGWNLSLGLLFGLPLLDGGDISALVLTQVRKGLITFPVLGPSGMVWTAFIVLLGSAVLVYVTRQYAWNYTHPTIVAGGYPMEAAPPAAHAAMQAGASAAAPPPLIQIAPVRSYQSGPGAPNEDRADGSFGS